MAKLTEDFFARDTISVARDLLGKYLLREQDGIQRVVRLTETEAYVGRCDKACHAYGYRRTKRTETLFLAPGTVYLYLIYGMYHCLNLVTEAEGEPCAVLLRGAEPVLGLPALTRARYGKEPHELSAYQQKNFLNGPGKLCRALSLTRAQNGTQLGNGLWLTDSAADFGLALDEGPARSIASGPRIGIDYAEEARDFPWRFWLR